MDDDDFIRDTIAMFLKTYGYLVRTFSSAQACLQALEEGSPACIVSDLNMPTMTGAELAHALRARSLDVPCLIVTAAIDSPLAQEAKDSGAVAGILGKPIDRGRLADAVSRVIRQPGASVSGM